MDAEERGVNEPDVLPMIACHSCANARPIGGGHGACQLATAPTVTYALWPFVHESYWCERYTPRRERAA